MARTAGDLIHGTVDLLILKTLSLGSMHGWAISKHIRQISEGVLEVNQGSLYPALYRLEDRGWIESRWGLTDRGREANLYSLTKAGERRLQEDGERWREYSMAVTRILEHAP